MENEKDGDLRNPQEWGKAPTKMTSVNFDAYLWSEAKRQGISLRDALEFGIKFLIADRDGFDYPNCKLQSKLHKVVEQRNALITEVENFKNPQPVATEEEIAKETDDVFSATPSKEGSE